MTNRVRGETQRGARLPRRRTGFTLPELLIVITILGVIGTLLSTILLRQQRFHRAVSSIADSRARMRDVATILPTDLRSISTAGSDILAMDVNSIQFRAFVGASVLCRYGAANIIELPPKVLASGNVLSAWINPPSPGDMVYVYDDGTTEGNQDDSWARFTITDATSDANPAWCPANNVPPYTTAADNASSRYRLTLDAAPNQAQIRIGAPIRFAREVRYSIYQAADRQYYVGYERCAPNPNPTLPGTDCLPREVLAGPVLPATTDTLTSGLFFVYYDQNGNRIQNVAQAGSIARISVGIRTNSESLLRATGNNSKVAGGDSLRFVIGLRNRV